jgi:hypothetical protein
MEAPHVDVPAALLESFRNAGAVVRRNNFSDDVIQWSIDGIVYDSEAWKAYERWARKQSVATGPIIMCHEVGYKVVENPDNEWKVIDEVRSITKHFSELAIESFEDSVAEQIPGPALDFSALERVKSPMLAIVMAEVIQSPPPAYCAINSLASGSFICAIVHMWARLDVTIEIYRK